MAILVCIRGEADKFGKLDILNGPGKIPVLDLKPGILEEHQAAVSSSSANYLMFSTPSSETMSTISEHERNIEHRAVIKLFSKTGKIFIVIFRM